MRRRPNHGTRRNASKRRGTPRAANAGRGRRRVSMVEVVTSSVDLDIRRVLRCAGDCVTLEEVMDVLARWLGTHAPTGGSAAPAVSSAAPSELRRRATVAGAVLAGYRACVETPWRQEPVGSRMGALA
ncbi:MAG: hypothetical protein ACXW61_02950 [Gemmatirosa sp.]